MDVFGSFLVLFCVSLAVGQIHHDHVGRAPCYDCSSLPCEQRLSCGLNEVCQVNYDHHSVHFHISCWEAGECLHTIHLGGRQQFCCSNQTCLDNAMGWLHSRLAAEQSSTSVPDGSTDGSHVVTLDYDAISCDYLANQSCAVMDALCPFVSCPDICKKCFKPIVTIPTTSAPVSDSHVMVDYGVISCGELANQGCGILEAVCPHVNCPDVCRRCFKPIVTVPTTVATPKPDSHVTVDYGVISCGELASQGCGILDAVCPHVTCPDVCRRCYKPIVTVPTTTSPSLLVHHGSDVAFNYDAISCEELAKQECAVMDVVCPHVNCPDACQICFSPIVKVTSSPSP